MRSSTAWVAGSVVAALLACTAAVTFGLVAGVSGRQTGAGCGGVEAAGGFVVTAGDPVWTRVGRGGPACGLRFLDRVQAGAGAGVRPEAAAAVALGIDGRRPRWGAQLSPGRPAGIAAGSGAAGSGALGWGATGEGPAEVMLIAALAVAAAAAGGAVATARALLRATTAAAAAAAQRDPVPRHARAEQVYGLPAPVRSCS